MKDVATSGRGTPVSVHWPDAQTDGDGPGAGRLTVSLPVFNEETTEAEFERMACNAREAADFLKALGHESRLMILCYLASGEKSVTELEALLSARQAAVSQQLMRLRQEGLVQTRREGKQIYYSLTDGRTLGIMNAVYDLFCS